MCEDGGSQVSDTHPVGYNFELCFCLEGRGVGIKSWLVAGFGVMDFGIRVLCESSKTCRMGRMRGKRGGMAVLFPPALDTAS